MTVKPIRKFVNPEMTFFILHYNFPLKLKYVISYGVAKMCLTYFISSKFQAHFKGISVWFFYIQQNDDDDVSFVLDEHSPISYMYILYKIEICKKKNSSKLIVIPFLLWKKHKKFIHKKEKMYFI